MNHRISNQRRTPEWLAAYVDGELTPKTRRQVEHWLAVNPDGRWELEAQGDLSPNNRHYWKLVEPPPPSAAAWSDVCEAIWHAAGAQRVSPVGQTRRLSWRFQWSVTGVAIAGLLVAVVSLQHTPSPVGVDAARVSVSESEEDAGIFPVASANEVELIRLPEEAAQLVVVGQHPIGNAPLLLASAGDVRVLNSEPDDQGNLPQWETDASMLWAPAKP